MAKGGDVAKRTFGLKGGFASVISRLSWRRCEAGSIATLLRVCVVLLSMPAMADSAPTPVGIVEGFYEAYLDANHEWGPDSPSALDLIFPHATPPLQRAIKKEHACQIREQGICTIDSDIIVNGQDWGLSEFRLSEVKEAGDRRVVVAEFVNIQTRMRVRYLFTLERGEWKIDEVEAISLKPTGEVDRQWSLRATLSR